MPRTESQDENLGWTPDTDRQRELLTESTGDEEWRAPILNPPVGASPSARLGHRHRSAVPGENDLSAVRVSR